ncbi:MAG: hypothetical protein GMKNLPBB_03045 [Myxococcota bacterium]|nr:hypothetical protein [Myxococcota bacterium]
MTHALAAGTLALLAMVSACGSGGQDDAGALADAASDAGAGDGAPATGTGGPSIPRADRYVGTCLESVYAGCFDAAGEVSCDYDKPGKTMNFSWPNGAKAQIVLKKFEEGGEARQYNSKGELCYRQRSDLNRAAQTLTVITIKDNQEYKVVTTYKKDANGKEEVASVTLTCPDGTSTQLPVIAGNDPNPTTPPEDLVCKGFSCLTAADCKDNDQCRFLKPEARVGVCTAPR